MIRNFKSGYRCPFDYRWLTNRNAYHVRGYGHFCGESCYIAYELKHNSYYSHLLKYVPDPRYYKEGDGWRNVKKWVRRKVKLNPNFKKG